MKLKLKLTYICLAFILVLGFLAVGVFAASKTSVNIQGTVSFVAKDIHAKITGEITGVDETGDEIKLEDLNYSATYEPTTELDSWKNKALTFKDKSSTIQIAITIYNLSKERKLYVDVTGDLTPIGNLTKGLKLGANPYTAGEVVEIDTENNKTFYIQMNIADTNLSVDKVKYDFKVNLNNDKPQSTESYNVDCLISNNGDDCTLTAATSKTPFDSANIYEIYWDGSLVGYLDSGNVDLLSKVQKSTNLEIKLYLGTFSFADIELDIEEYTVKGPTEDLELGYTIYTITAKVTSDITITIEGDLSEIEI